MHVLLAGGREHSQNWQHAGPFPSDESEKAYFDHVLYLVSSNGTSVGSA